MSIIEREHAVEVPAVTEVPSILDPRVERGAALLDEKMPGWAERVNVDTLNVASICDCVLGQVYGGFGVGAVVLWPPRDVIDRDDRDDIYRGHGFYTFSDEGDYEAVQQDWRLAILARRS